MYNITEPVYVDAKDLNDINGLLITSYSTYTPPANNLYVLSVPLYDRSVAVSRNEQSKKINIKGIIRTNDRTQLEDSLDTLNRYVKKLNVLLNVPLRNDRYEYRNTSYSNMVISNVKGGMAEIDIEFICTDPHSYATTLSIAKGTTNLTASNQSLTVDFSGNTGQAPIITINSLAVEPETTDKSFTITNPTTSESVTVNRTYTDGEEIVFNFDTRQVTVDGIVVDYSGILFAVDPDVEALHITDSFTTRSYNIKIEYYKRFM